MKRARIIPGPAGAIFVKGQSATSESFMTENDNTAFRTTPSSCSSSNWKKILKLIFGSDDNAENLSNFVATISDIHDGLCDLKIPHLVVIVEEITKSIDGSYSLKLADPTGEIFGFISKMQWQAIKKLTLQVSLQKGVILYLQQASIFVQKTPFVRFVSVHANNLRFVASNPST